MLRNLLCSALLVVAASSSAPVAQVSRPNPLKGVTKVTVQVLLAADQAPFVITRDRLRTILELRLRTAGLTVLSEAEDSADPDINPTVQIDIVIIPSQTVAGQIMGYACHTRLSVREYRLSPRNQALVPIELWDRGRMNVASSQTVVAAIERTTNEFLDGVVSDWLGANPR